MFFILDTAHRLGFTQVLAQMEPRSPQGRKAKKSLTPFLPGDEAAFDQMTKRLQFWLDLAEQSGILETIQPLLADLRSIEGILERLAEGMPLDEGECFEIKANLVTSRKIWELLWETLLGFIQSDNNVREALPEWLQEYSFERVSEAAVPQWTLKVTVDPSLEPDLEPEEMPNWVLGRLEEIIDDLKALEPIFQLNSLNPLWELLNPGGVISDRFYLRDEYDPQLAQVRHELGLLQREIKARQREEIADVEALLGRTIAPASELMVSKSDEELVNDLKARPNWRIERDSFSAYFFRYTPGPAVQTLEERRNLKEAEEERIALRVLADLSEEIRAFLPQLEQNQDSLGDLDWMLAKVRFALEHRCVPAERVEVKRRKHPQESWNTTNTDLARSLNQKEANVSSVKPNAGVETSKMQHSEVHTSQKGNGDLPKASGPNDTVHVLTKTTVDNHGTVHALTEPTTDRNDANSHSGIGQKTWNDLTPLNQRMANSGSTQAISTPNMIQIRNGRHLLVEADVKARGSEYTPIDITLHDGVTVITGSNMGGKTLNLRMIGLLTAMAQYGLYVPATSMRFTLREFIYFSVDDDHTKGDLSTFGQEIVGLNQALPRKQEPGLILIDELARGTNPEEGSSLGRAIIKYLLDSPSITVLTTHFAALTQVPGVRHLKVLGLNQAKYEILQNRYNENTISLKMINNLMDYHLVEVGASDEVSRDAIRVAALLGLDHRIIATAEQELDGDI